MRRTHISEKLGYWFLGILIITGILWYFVLRFPGYVMFADLSASFNFRNPFEMYFHTYTQYDGVEVGIKQRAPLVSVIWLITSLLSPLFGGGKEQVVKFAIWLMFIGSFSAFYFLYPRITNFFLKRDINNKNKYQLEVHLILALLYSFIPFFSYRIWHVQMFFFSSFYILNTYLFLRLLERKGNKAKDVIIFTLAHFFGITTPHSILYLALTYLFLFIGFCLNSKRQEIIERIGLLVITLVFTLLISTFWLYPLLSSSQLSPGYVIQNQIVEVLSYRSSLQNFLLDSSEWYMGQYNYLGALSDIKILQFFQLAGLMGIYAIGIRTIFVNRRNPYIISILLLLITTLLLGVKESPIFSFLYSRVLFSKFGWMIREANKIHIVWSFWFYILFAFGIDSILERISSNISKFYKVLSFIVISTILGITGIYFLLTFYGYTPLLKPTPVSDEFFEVQEYFDKNPDKYGAVYYFPRGESYSISWDTQTFPLVDVSNYNNLAYNLFFPPAQISSGNPVSRSIEDHAGEYALSPKILATDRASILSNFGIRYILIDKKANGLSDTALTESDIYEQYTKLLANKNFDRVVDNKYYSLFENNQLDIGAVQIFNQRYSTYEGLDIIPKLDFANSQQILFNQYPNLGVLESDAVISSNNDEYAYLDLVPNTYKSFPYDYSFDAIPHVAWGRSSLVGTSTSDFSYILKNVGIENFYQYDFIDKVAYSDISMYEDNIDTEKNVDIPNSCKTNCNVYAKVLMNVNGGDLTFQLSDVSNTIDTKGNINRFIWVNIASNINLTEYTKSITLRTDGGFIAINSIIVIPAEVDSEYLKIWNEQNNIYLDRQSIPLDTLNESCSFVKNNYMRRELTNYIDLEGYCNNNVYFSIPMYHNDVLIYDTKSKEWSINEDLTLPQGQLDLKVYLLPKETLIFWGILLSELLLVFPLVTFLSIKKLRNL